MNAREMAWASNILNYAMKQKEITEFLISEVECLIAYDKGRKALNQQLIKDFGCDLGSYTSDNDVVASNNLNEPTLASKGGEEEVSLCFTDGSFRVVRKSGLLQYRFMHKGKQESVYGKTKEECYQKRVDLYMGILERKPVTKTKKEKKRKDNYTYEEWAKKWYEIYKLPAGYKTGYLKTINGYLRNQILPILGKKQLADITSLSLKEFLVNIKSDCTRTKIAAVLSESLRDAKIAGLIDRNPYEGIKIKRYEQPRLGALTHAQQVLLLNALHDVDNKIRAFTLALLMTGARQGELNGLQAKNVDLANMEIRIETTWDKHDRKLVSPKTKSGRRCIPIAQPLADILKPFVVACSTPDDRIFGYDDANYTPRFFSKLFKKIGMHFTGHIMRHTFITNAYELGFPPYLIQRWVGHSRLEQADVYLALRKPAEYIETEITFYMKLLKDKTVL